MKSFETSLGYRAERREKEWVVDLSQLPLFHGLSILSQALGELVLDQINSPLDLVEVGRIVRARENPELRENLRITEVKLRSRKRLIAKIASNAEHFQDELRILFGTLQRKKYRDLLFPQRRSTPT